MNNKKLIIRGIILILSSIFLLLTIFYNKIFNIKKYTIINGDTYQLFQNSINDNGKYNGKKIKHNEFINLDYPQINIDANEIIELNNHIKEMYENLTKEYLSLNEYGCTCVKINDKYHCSDGIKTIKYNIYKFNNLLTLNFEYGNVTYCFGELKILNGYTISLSKKKILSNKEMLDYFNFDEDKFINNYNNFIKNNSIQTGNKIENINSFNMIIYNNKLLVSLSLPYTNYYEYNGINFIET